MLWLLRLSLQTEGLFLVHPFQVVDKHQLVRVDVTLIYSSWTLDQVQRTE